MNHRSLPPFFNEIRSNDILLLDKTINRFNDIHLIQFLSHPTIALFIKISSLNFLLVINSISIPHMEKEEEKKNVFRDTTSGLIATIWPVKK